MAIHLVNPSHLSFGIGVITPRWLFVLAAATPTTLGQPQITDETLDPFDMRTVQPGRCRRNRHPHRQCAARLRDRRTRESARSHCRLRRRPCDALPGRSAHSGGAHAVVKGDGDVVWPLVLGDAARGALQPVYEAGRVAAERFVSARWDLLPQGRYMWGSVQTVRGCPKHCSFCSVWRTDGQTPRQRRTDVVVDEILELRRRGFRFVALADDNFYPVTLTDLALAERQQNMPRLEQLRAAAGGAVRADGPTRAAAVRHGVLHPDHDGSGRGSRLPDGDARAQTSKVPWWAWRP